MPLGATDSFWPVIALVAIVALIFLTAIGGLAIGWCIGKVTRGLPVMIIYLAIPFAVTMFAVARSSDDWNIYNMALDLFWGALMGIYPWVFFCVGVSNGRNDEPLVGSIIDTIRFFYRK